LTAQSLQGDVGFVRALEQMGCEVLHEAGALGIQGRPLRGIRINMNEISDTVMTLASVACFAKGPTHITDVAHIRHKETDRITATVTELRKLGVNVQEHEDGLTIVPSVMHPARLATYNDHRMAMSFAVLGLKVPGLEIENPGCVIKTYPGFWEDWQKLG
jgi:3-phosphoshikimate 1-carboxyvinyltransferase